MIQRELTLPTIPDELLEPVPAPSLDRRTRNATAELLIDYEKALTVANAKLETIGDILAGAEQILEGKPQ